MAQAETRDGDGFLLRGAQGTRLEAFVDAAFAFAVTLLVIGGSEVPTSTGQLLTALKDVPAFAASFALICHLWWSHYTFSQRYGLEDATAAMLSLALVFLVLVFVYPLKMLFASFFGWISNGWLMTQPFSFKDFSELRSMFAVYGAAWTVLSLLVSAQLLHAWRLRTVLALSPLEQLGTRFELYGALVNAAFGLIAVALALSLPERMPHGWMYSLPGSIYFGLGPARWGLRAVELRARQRLPADL